VGAISLRFVSDGSDDPPRVAYAIGRQVGSAVIRNRIRRRLRAALAHHESELQTGGAYLVSADRAALNAPFEALVGQVGSLLRPPGAGKR